MGLRKCRIPNALVNRLFLNLRSYQNPSYGLSSSDTTLPAPVFAQNRPNRFLGNIGEPLDYGQWDDVLDEEGVDDGAAENKRELNDIRDPLTTLVPVVSVTLLSTGCLSSNCLDLLRSTKEPAQRILRWYLCNETLCRLLDHSVQ